MTLPLFPAADASITVVAITGGRWHTPTQAELVAFVAWLRFNEVRTLVHGDCNGDDAKPRGVDALVSAYVARFAEEMGITVEPWPALWGRFRRGAGPRRNGKMLIGDRRDWGGQHRGRPVDTLVSWPGNVGTGDCIDQADSLRIRHITIADVVQQVSGYAEAP